MSTITTKLADFAASLNSVSYISNDGGYTNYSVVNFEDNTILNFSTANLSILTTVSTFSNSITSNSITSNIISSNSISNRINVTTSNITVTSVANTNNLVYNTGLYSGPSPAFTLANIKYLTTGTSATYTTPDGVRALYIEVMGAGGGGGSINGAGFTTISSCGAGGGFAKALIRNPAASYTYTIGANGVGGIAGPTANAGSTGGTTTFTGSGITISASGGRGGSGADGDGTGVFLPVGLGGGRGSLSGISGMVGAGTQAEASRLSGGTVYQYPHSGYCPLIGGGVWYGAGNVSNSAARTVGNGVDASLVGEGGAAAYDNGTTTNYTGGDGGAGLIVITEYF